MSPFEIGSLAIGGANALSNLFNRSPSYKELANYQFNLNKQLFDYENAYNTPLKQIQRYRDAGLNPMFYGVDGSGTASMQPVSVSEGAAVQESSRLRTAQLIDQLSARVQQQEQINSQVSANEAAANQANANAEKARADAEAVIAGLPSIRAKNSDDAINTMMMEFDNTRRRINLFFEQLENPDIRRALLHRPRWEVENLQAQYFNTQMDTALKKFNIESVLPESLRTMKYQQRQMAAYASKAISDISVNDKLRKLYQSQANKFIWDGYPNFVFGKQLKTNDKFRSLFLKNFTYNYLNAPYKHIETKSRTNMLKYQDQMQEADWWFDKATGLLNSLTGAAGAVKGTKFMPYFSGSSNASVVTPDGWQPSVEPSSFY